VARGRRHPLLLTNTPRAPRRERDHGPVGPLAVPHEHEARETVADPDTVSLATAMTTGTPHDRWPYVVVRASPP
jgi:pyridoxine/pyridoxamine 5'-phosphate oxidase